MKMAKLGFAAVAALLLFTHCELGQAMALRVRGSLGQGPVRMARGSPAEEGMKTMAARAVQTSSDKSAEEDDVFLAPLVHLIGRYTCTSRLTPASRRIAEHCRWKFSLRCVKKAVSKWT
ncbi:hypothetical protein SETIT_8G133800v2 [Setaria italica]|uniref:Uncharacterized protein n=1 Tax=Setaria italica TaxID=4555 RepID=K3ZKB9_SETIT|nr:hypothetical protein SETIT_8G133800v2 [Setaria italica]